ncbi:MAG: hypothetical protein AB1644_06955 [Candidatus Zixiibacteriota bacterium]
MARKCLIPFMVAVVVLMAISCQDDWLVPPVDDSVEGEYVGWLTYDSWAPGTQLIDSQYVRWVFTSNTYSYKRPDSIPDSVPRPYFDSYGTYQLTDALVLADSSHGITGEVCDLKRNLNGRFVVVEHIGPKLRFAQSLNGVLKTANLTRL